MDPQYEAAGATGMPYTDQQEYLLRASGGESGVEFPSVTTSAAHLSEQIERGGARIEETLSRMKCRYQTLFFVASWIVIISAIIGSVASLANFELSTLINSVFLFGFGITVMLLDMPGTPRWAGIHRRGVRKYARFLTRLTGKSLTFLYLGCMVIVCLWPRRRLTSSAFLLFLALACSLVVDFVGAIGLFIALRKSLRLERVRKAIHYSYQSNWNDVYRKYAVNDPSHGMQYEEFNRLASDYTQGKLIFDLSDLHLIFNALDEHQKSAINEIEFGYWIAGGYDGSDSGETLMTFL